MASSEGVKFPQLQAIADKVINSLEKKPATIWNIPPKLAKEAKREIIRWGPYLLLPANVGLPYGTISC
jgi:hypothetical protein